jgi:hypothetical protein
LLASSTRYPASRNWWEIIMRNRCLVLNDEDGPYPGLRRFPRSPPVCSELAKVRMRCALAMWISELPMLR